jgi:transcriptional regulator with XRE-family HTH domain
VDADASLREMGSRIRALRKSRKLSRRVLAELAGLHENTLKAIEGGAGNPTYRVIAKIAEVLSVAIVDLLR